VSSNYLKSNLELTEFLRDLEEQTKRKPERVRGFYYEALDLVFSVAGIYVFYIYYALLQEKLFTSHDGEESFHFPLFLTLVQCIINSAFARGVLRFYPAPQCNITQLQYASMAFTYLAGMISSYEALNYINFPTTVLVKCCKMLPLMFLGLVLYRKSYSLREYACVIFITVGIFLFLFFKKGATEHDSKVNTPIGILLAVVSLTMDGLTGAQQDRLVSKHKPSAYVLMYEMNKWAILHSAIACVLTGQGASSIGFLANRPSVVATLLLFGVVSALGQCFVFHMVTIFGALPLSIVTTTRKFFTILASVVWYGHPVSILQWLGVVCVFSGLGVDVGIKAIRRRQTLDGMKGKEHLSKEI